MMDCGARMPPELVAACEGEGVELLGIADASYSAEAFARYMRWLEAGYHGDMVWLERHAQMKYAAERILPGCRSILLFGLSYYQDGEVTPGAGRVARYAWGRDYHKVLGNRLRRLSRRLSEAYPGDQFKGYTDAVPLDERHYAMQGGVGFTGRNTLLITRTMGSWLVLGEVLSTRQWPVTLAASKEGCPPACRRCLEACPTGALMRPGEIDARRCISYLTIESKGPIPEGLRSKMGNWIFGCDACQEVCPFQVRKRVTREKDFLCWRAGPSLSPAEILGMDAAAFEARFAGSPVMRAGLWRMQRNACIVAGNLRDEGCFTALKELACGADAILREHADWALAQM